MRAGQSSRVESSTWRSRSRSRSNGACSCRRLRWNGDGYVGWRLAGWQSVDRCGLASCGWFDRRGVGGEVWFGRLQLSDAVNTISLQGWWSLKQSSCKEGWAPVFRWRREPGALGRRARLFRGATASNTLAPRQDATKTWPMACFKRVIGSHSNPLQESEARRACFSRWCSRPKKKKKTPKKPLYSSRRGILTEAHHLLVLRNIPWHSLAVTFQCDISSYLPVYLVLLRQRTKMPWKQSAPRVASISKASKQACKQTLFWQCLGRLPSFDLPPQPLQAMSFIAKYRTGKKKMEMRIK